MVTRSQRKQTKNKSKKKRFLKVFGIVVLLLALAGGGYAFYVYNAVKNTANKMHLDFKPTSGKRAELSSGKTPINVLLLGVDERPGDRGRSDTIIIATLNPKTNSMLMTSIPRDTRTEIVGYNTTSKINSAYAHGGVEMATKTVEKMLDIKIDYVAKINMEGLSDLVDAVGGITVTNKLDWYDEGFYKKGFHYKKGVLYLDGPQALGYARMRHYDNRGDFGRNERQRQVITAILNKGKSLTSVAHMQAILDAVGSNVKTNLTFDEMKSIATNYRQCRENIYDYEAYGTTKTINGASYVLVSQEERNKIHTMIQEEKDGTLDMSKYKKE